MAFSPPNPDLLTPLQRDLLEAFFAREQRMFLIGGGALEIAANKVCTLLSRSEIKDLVDMQQLVAAGVDVDQAFVDAEKKDGGSEPATLAWVLDQLSIAPSARLPGGVDPVELDRFRVDFIKRLRALAFSRARLK